ncbi:MAG: PhoU family transcriptional regulator [Desulfovibrionaceae bacterium]|nr:PhoU family transcriptional regulator [Desulfovibrionaceae bacterium]
MNTTETKLLHDLTSLRTRLLVMCTSVGIALDKTSAILVEGRDRTKEMRDGDAAINTLEMEIDELALTILACNQPVAQDLRFVVASLRMVLDLERIGDEAVDIAERAMLLHAELPASGMAIVHSLMDMGISLYSRAVECFRDYNAEKAMALCRESKDSGRREILAVQNMVDFLCCREDLKENWEPYAGLQGLLTCRALNRVCRRAVNIAEQTFFIVRGENIKHISLKP